MPLYVERQHSSRLGVAQAPLAFTTTSVTSAAFGPETFQIRAVCQLTTGTDAHITIGDNTTSTPVATTSATLLPVNLPEYFTVTPGQKIAVIGGSGAAGTLYVTEIT
jgi:hypothetical protein